MRPVTGPTVLYCGGGHGDVGRSAEFTRAQEGRASARPQRCAAALERIAAQGRAPLAGRWGRAEARPSCARVFRCAARRHCRRHVV